MKSVRRILALFLTGLLLMTAGVMAAEPEADGTLLWFV